MRSKGWLLGIGAVLIAANLQQAAADTVRLDPSSRRFDRRIPSSADFTLDIPVPGKELIRGELEVWPVSASGECNLPDGERQHYKLAMVANGTEGERVLRATVPALQVNTPFCFGVKITRGLDDVAAVGFASSVVAEVMKKKVAFDAGCSDVGALRNRLANEISAGVARVTTVQLESAQSAVREEVRGLTKWTSATMESSASRAIGKVVVDGIDLESLCEVLSKAASLADLASKNAQKANVARLAAQAPIDPVRTVPLLTTNVAKARVPLWVSGTGTSLEVRRFADVVDQEAVLSAAAQALEPISAELARLLRAIPAKPADREPFRKAFHDALAKLIPQPVTLVYSRGTTRLQIRLDELFTVLPAPADTWADRLQEKRTILLENLDLLKRQMATYILDDSVNAKPWFLALDKLHAADQAYQAANVDLMTKVDSRETARQAIATKLKERLVSADVRALVVSVSAIQSDQKIVAPETDAGASSVAADIGVLLAFPFHVNRDRDDWEPWLVPYAGVNIYRSRVDRVVPFDQLVGSFAKQRLSLTLGALLTRPKLNGESISMPFRDNGIIPVVAVGVRLTSFTRFTIGGFAFDYQDPNPATDKKHRGGAVWFGLSIDADVWAAIQGKAFK